MGILDRIGAFRPSPVAGQGQAGGMLTGMAPAEALFARNLGGLLGRDMRSPQEKLQAELKGVEDKTSAAGLQEQAKIFANLGTPQAIELALQLQNRAAALSKTQTDAENLRKARVQITQTP